MYKNIKNNLLSLSLVAAFFVVASGSAFIANAQGGDSQRLQADANISQDDASTMEIDLVRIPLPVDFEDQSISIVEASS